MLDKGNASQTPPNLLTSLPTPPKPHPTALATTAMAFISMRAGQCSNVPNMNLPSRLHPSLARLPSFSEPPGTFAQLAARILQATLAQ